MCVNEVMAEAWMVPSEVGKEKCIFFTWNFFFFFFFWMWVKFVSFLVSATCPLDENPFV